MDVATCTSSGGDSIWLQRDGGGGGTALWACVSVCFHFKAEWAFNMQLWLCLSVNRSLMSCYWCSLWEGLGIIKHFQWVPRRKMTGSLTFFIINKKEAAAPLSKDFNQLKFIYLSINNLPVISKMVMF